MIEIRSEIPAYAVQWRELRVHQTPGGVVELRSSGDLVIWSAAATALRWVCTRGEKRPWSEVCAATVVA